VVQPNALAQSRQVARHKALANPLRIVGPVEEVRPAQ
jgi:hypothetical protein